MAAATAGLGLAALVAERSHANLVATSPMPPFPGVSVQDWYNSKESASRLIVSTLIGAGVTAVLGIVTAIVSRYVESPVF